MKVSRTILAFVFMGLPAVAVTAGAQIRPAQGAVKQEKRRMEHLTGTFDVKTLPQKADNKEAEAAGLGRMSLDKQFHGDIEATSTGEMLYIGTEVEGSRAYVALERVKGTLRGKNGGFAMYHVGLMKRGETSLTIKIVEDSGTGDLKGITGSMTIRVENGKHFYDLEYSMDGER